MNLDQNFIFTPSIFLTTFTTHIFYDKHFDYFLVTKETLLPLMTSLLNQHPLE